MKKLISRGSPEVTFCSWTKIQRAYERLTFSEIVRDKNLYYRRLMANLRRPTRDVQIWILGIVLILDPHLINSPDFLFDILLNIGLFPKFPPKIYNPPLYPLYIITIGPQKENLSAPLPGNCSELRCASFSEKCTLQETVSVSGDNLTPYV